VAKGSRVFLAHSSIDKKLVRELYKKLKEQGLDPWLDEEDLIPGQLWTLEIPKAIRECEFVIACLSERAIQRQGYLHKEFRMALEAYAEKPPGSIYLIPLKFDDCDVPAIALPQLGIDLRHIQWVDYWKPNGMTRLLKAVGKESSSVTPDQSMLVDSLGMEFVPISPGTFIMGSPENEEDRWDDETQHKVTLTQGVYMGVTQVTVGQFRRFVKATGYRTEAETDGGAYIWTGEKWEKKAGRYWDNPGFDQTDEHPVTCVSWNDVQDFIKKLNQRESQYNYRLPTEAEWEYAARAGTTTPFGFGETLDTDQANYDGNYPYAGGPRGIYRKKTTPVKNFSPNAWGLYDMHGNVWEWCQDWYGDYPSGSVTDPQGPQSGDDRVLRGGSWLNFARLCRSAYRNWRTPDDRRSANGFRLVAPLFSR
jgi:formylglycine-generating enzyme required for sulfatase activity